MKVCKVCGMRKVRYTLRDGPARVGQRMITVIVDGKERRQLAPCNGKAEFFCRKCIN